MTKICQHALLVEENEQSIQGTLEVIPAPIAPLMRMRCRSITLMCNECSKGRKVGIGVAYDVVTRIWGELQAVKTQLQSTCSLGTLRSSEPGMLQAARRQPVRCHVSMRDHSRVHVTIHDLHGTFHRLFSIHTAFYNPTSKPPLGSLVPPY